MSFSTLPQWMFQTEKPVAYPADPDEITWNYGGGSGLRDPSLKEVVNYYHRLASWYMKGGSTTSMASGMNPGTESRWLTGKC